MEIVLLWLDEIDDLLFAFFLRWERLRKYCLTVSLLAALMLHGGDWSGVSSRPELAFVNVSVFGILAWSTVSLASLALDHRVRRSSATA